MGTVMSRVSLVTKAFLVATSSRTGVYWPLVVFVRTSLRLFRTATTVEAGKAIQRFVGFKLYLIMDRKSLTNGLKLDTCKVCRAAK